MLTRRAAERLTELETFAANAKHQRAWRPRTDRPFVGGEYCLGREGMGRVQKLGASAWFTQLERCAGSPGAGIDEDHELPSLQVQRVLDLQLILDQYLDIRETRIVESLRQHGAERIVTAARIADRQHQQGCDSRGQSRTI